MLIELFFMCVTWNLLPKKVWK